MLAEDVERGLGVCIRFVEGVGGGVGGWFKGWRFCSSRKRIPRRLAGQLVQIVSVAIFVEVLNPVALIVVGVDHSRGR